jgi:hypothetical protein
VTINNSVFNNTALLLNNFFADENFEIHVEYNSFSSNSPSLTGISAWNYKKFSIKNNEISGFRNGLEMNQCGLGTTINQVISDNTIHDNLISGIVIYTSNAYVSKNHLYQNDFGVRLLNNSNIALAGNPSANMLIGTQTIMDNDGIEVYTNTNSFPSYFRYNAVIDEDNLGNPDDPLLFFDRPCGTHISKNIQYNCWGNNFNPDEDLKSCNVDFYPYPTWCPTGGELAIPGPDEVLYNTGVSQFDSGYYTGAQSSFQSLVQQYPESKYAEASLKELYQLEEYAANDYPGLREYYLTNDSIMADTALSDVGDFLANKCNVKIQNWPDAILWYENKIENPEVPEDTIFSIIDLGYIYILMENEGTKNSYIGSLPQYKPKSFEDFNRRKNELLELLPLKHNFNPFEESLRTLQSESLMQNIPNPFSTSTDIWYKLSDPAGVQIKFYDNFGRIVRIITKGEVSEGTHKITFDAAGLSAGIYHCTLEVNGTLAGTKNMVVVK